MCVESGEFITSFYFLGHDFLKMEDSKTVLMLNFLNLMTITDE
jgi:hypothetical protein